MFSMICDRTELDVIVYWKKSAYLLCEQWKKSASYQKQKCSCLSSSGKEFSAPEKPILADSRCQGWRAGGHGVSTLLFPQSSFGLSEIFVWTIELRYLQWIRQPVSCAQAVSFTGFLMLCWRVRLLLFFFSLNFMRILYNDVPVMLLAMNQQSIYVHALIEAWSCLAVQMLKSVRLLIKIKYLHKCFF